MDNNTNAEAVNDNKLKALTNEPVKVIFGGEEFTLRRPTIKDYKKIRAFLKENNADVAGGKLPDDVAIDFGTFFIATLLINPPYTQEQLEEKILISDLPKLTDMMEQLGFTKPQPKAETTPEVKLTPLEEENK